MKIDKTSVLFLAAIAALGFIIYANVLSGDFLWDDYHLVKNNTYIRDWSNIPRVFTEHVGSGGMRKYHFYRPMQIFTYAIDYSIWGGDVFGHHLMNVILHILAAICVYWLILTLFKEKIMAGIAALLFVAHPLHTEAISYISGRPDPLATLFLLIAFILYVKDTAAPKIYYSMLSVMCFTLALLSREASLILPFLILAYHAAFKRPVNKKLFFALLGAAAFYIYLRLSVFKSMMPEDMGNATVFHRLPGAFVALTNYARLMIAPIDLHMGYGRKLFLWSDAKAVIGVVILITSLTAAVMKRKKNGLLFFSVLWFFIALFPYCNIAHPINAYMAEHWLYLPSIGIFLLAAKGLMLLRAKTNGGALVAAIMAGLLSFYIFIGVKQNTYWRDPFLFYNRTLEFVKDSPEVYNNLGVLYGRRGDFSKAIPLFKVSIETDESYPDPYFNLGKSYNETGKKREAVLYYTRALDLFPERVTAESYYTLANIFNEMEEYDKAIEYFKKALKLNPRHVHSYDNMALAYHYKGDNAAAIKLLNTALRIDPRDPYAYVNLAAIYYTDKEYQTAIGYLDKAEKLGITNKALAETLEPYRDRADK
jgi:tetratricopeptide (TPR) repeat protein